MDAVLRFLTLTTSEVQRDNVENRGINHSFQVLRYRIVRVTPAKLINQGYLKPSDARRYYPNKPLIETLEISYFKVCTNEGNGVLHIIFRGDYLPYNYLVDNWNDIHNSWGVDIRKVGKVGSSKGLAGYFVNQYIVNQNCSYFRFSQSYDWIYKGFCSDWLFFKSHFSGQELFDAWERHIHLKFSEQSNVGIVQELIIVDFG
jgi:hypothetical protein